MTLDSTSTIAQVTAAYADNASYAETGDVAKARLFVTACRLLLMMTPKAQTTENFATEYSPELIQKQLEEAQQWLRDSGAMARPTIGRARATRASFSCFRD